MKEIKLKSVLVPRTAFEPVTLSLKVVFIKIDESNYFGEKIVKIYTYS